MLLFLFFSLFAPSPARADLTDCWNRDHTYYNCDEGGGAVGASAPLMGDTLGENPAALPTVSAPFGIEGIFDSRAAPSGKSKASVSTVKGFEGIGFGVGSWSEGSFGAPNFREHYLGTPYYAEYLNYEKNPPSVIGARLGTAILLPKKLMPKGLHVSIGGSVGFGRVSGDISPQAGVLARVFGIGLGYSQSFERLTTVLPRARISNYSAGFFLGPIYLGYTYAVIDSSVNHTYSNTVSLRLTPGPWIFYGGIKTQKDHRGAPDTWTMGGVQRRLGQRFGFGYEYGNYRFSHSAILQVFL